MLQSNCQHPASYSGSQETASQLPVWGFAWFSFILPAKCWDSALKQAITASFHILSIHSSLILPFSIAGLQQLTGSLNNSTTTTITIIIIIILHPKRIRIVYDSQFLDIIFRICMYHLILSLPQKRNAGREILGPLSDCLFCNSSR